MRSIAALLLFGVVGSLAQTDTLYYDPSTGNYVIRYLGVTYEGADTLISFEFEPATKIDPIISCRVVASGDGEHSYVYRVLNGSRARQNLREFSLHFGAGVSVRSSTPLTSWDNRRPRAFLPDTGWANRWVWRGHQGLEPTCFIDSCIIVGNGLPSVTDSYSQAVHRILVWPADQKNPDPINISAELGRLDSYPNNNILRRTVGPMLPPDPFIGSAFCDTIRGYIDQSHELNWILEQPVVVRIKARLLLARELLIAMEGTGSANGPLNRAEAEMKRVTDTWKRELGKENVPDSVVAASRSSLGEFEAAKRLTSPDKRRRALMLAAKLLLRSIVTEVDLLYRLSERGPKVYLTSEAYALVKFNTEYLIERLE